MYQNSIPIPFVEMDLDDDDDEHNVLEELPSNEKDQQSIKFRQDPFGTFHIDLTFLKNQLKRMQPNCIRGNIGSEGRILARKVGSCLLNSTATTVRKGRMNEERNRPYFENETIMTLGFLRIPKTASTAMLAFLHRFQNHARRASKNDPSSNIRSNRTILPWPYFIQMVAHERVTHQTQAKHVGCMIVATDVGPSRLKYPNASHYQHFKGWQQCPHVNYQQLWAVWAASLRYTRLPPHIVPLQNTGVEDGRSNQKTAGQIHHRRAALSTYTIVREPLDRLKSYFHFW